MTKPVVCLLTDFGLTDHYAGVMKGVLAAALPDVQIVDITHDIPPQNVRLAAFELLASYAYMPKDAVCLCVVDPGVGGDRKILYAQADGRRFIAPDNGLLSWVFDRVKPQAMVHVDPLKINANASATFHGRDIMAPLAARILKGEPPEKFGTPTTSYVKLPFPIVLKHGSLWQAEIIVVDNFGNLVTNVRLDDVKPLADASKLWVEFDKTTETIRGLSPAYTAVELGRLLALEGSSGFLEIAVNQGSAAARTRMGVGDRVNIHFRA